MNANATHAAEVASDVATARSSVQTASEPEDDRPP